MCTPSVQGSYAGAETMLRKALDGADEQGAELIEVEYTLGVLADALQSQVGLGEVFQTSPHNTRVLSCEAIMLY